MGFMWLHEKSLFIKRIISADGKTMCTPCSASFPIDLTAVTMTKMKQKQTGATILSTVTKPVTCGEHEETCTAGPFPSVETGLSRAE